jgi:hypothetical protein
LAPQNLGHVRSVLQGKPVTMGLLHVAFHVLRSVVGRHEDDLQIGFLGDILYVGMDRKSHKLYRRMNARLGEISLFGKTFVRTEQILSCEISDYDDL